MTDVITRLSQRLQAANAMVATAESCTAGLISKQLTDPAGSSQWFERGFVTYSNDAKQEMLGVSAQTLADHGAVSEATVIEMAKGAIANSHAQFALAVSGIAGPDGGMPGKPVGTVWFACADRGLRTEVVRQHFDGDRDNVRHRAAEFALALLLDFTGSG